MTPKLQNKSHAITRNEALNQIFEQFDILHDDERSELLCMTSHSDFKKNRLAQTHLFFHLSLLITAFYKAGWFDLTSPTVILVFAIVSQG